MSANSSSSPYVDLQSIIDSLFVTRLVLLAPLSVFILYLAGFQWKQQRSFRNAAHSDLFAYNIAAMEMFWCLGGVLYYWLLFSADPGSRCLAYFLVSLIFFGETGFHMLTCLDRYLAVVHPVKYQALRASRGASIRNSSILSVWILSVVLSWTSARDQSIYSYIVFFSLFISSLLVVSFCSFSVLHALLHPGPGGRAKGNGDQSKQRAFYTVTSILGTLLLFFIGFLVSTVVTVFDVLSAGLRFLVQFGVMWLSVPSSLVLPLLHLYKIRKQTKARS